MVGFRRRITALAVLALFAGLASAQVSGNNQLTCSTNVSVTPSLRQEGYTEQTGDITLTCSGGSSPTPGSQIPQVNITVFLNTAVTSRLLPIAGTNAVANASEALLLIDEPGSGLAGYGPSLTQKVCATPDRGCIQYVGATGAAPGPGPIFVPGNTLGTAVTTPTGNTFGENVFQGIVSGNSVTWFGVPVLPPVTSGASRVYRITNVRANANALSGGSASGSTPVIASISISGATSLLITNPTPTIGFVLPGLVAGVSGAASQNQCASQTRASLTTLSFAEGFGTAFKTRVSAQSNVQYAGQNLFTAQNVPGLVYNSESNFVFGGTAGGQAAAGLADFGTRLKATFNNVPPGVRLFVSTTNVVNSGGGAIVAPAVIGGSAGNTGTLGYAQLLNPPNAESTFSNFVSSGTFTQTVTDATSGSPQLGPGGSGNVPVAEIPVVNGSATAIWEVVNTNPNAQETLRFGVYSTYSANVAQNSPPAGTATVNLSFAPTPPAFSASDGARAQVISTSAASLIPRFIADSSAARNILVINICRTILLYPYVTNFPGFDTGVAIANTSTDPFGTGAQAGSCKLNWYQGATNPPQTDTGNIASGTVYANTAAILAPGFTGYMIAVCSFQYAHGFAFISDLGTRNFAMGYLALVISDPASNSNSRAVRPLGNLGIDGSGEQSAH